MKRRNKFTPALALAAAAIGIIAIAVSVTNPIAHAGGDTDRHGAVNVLPPVGITVGQTLRVSFLNVGSNPLEVIPCVFDGDGTHLKTGALLTLAPGQMRTFDFSRSDIAGRTESSVEVRAGVHANRSDLKHLAVSGELFEEATGKSSLFVPGKKSSPESDHRGLVTSSLAPVGIVAGQTLRVIFLNVGANPLEVIPCIFDGDGLHLQEGARVSLAPGQMRSLELSWSEAVGERTETRVQLRGAVHVSQRNAKNLVIAGEVIEDATGRSSLYVSPATKKGFDPQPDPPQ